jgi:hypothetical protein
LIRLAYGLEAGDEREIAAACVYWRDAYLDLGLDTQESSVPFQPGVTIARLRTELAGIALPKGLIFKGMAAAAADPRFTAALRAGGSPRSAADLGAIAHFVVRWFAATRGFTALHAMTGTHAFRIVQSHLELATALPALWRAICAAYAAAGFAAIGEPGAPALPAWDELLAAAVASDDEHDIKAAYTAWSEERAYGGELYRLAAARYLRLAV